MFYNHFQTYFWSKDIIRLLHNYNHFQISNQTYFLSKDIMNHCQMFYLSLEIMDLFLWSLENVLHVRFFFSLVRWSGVPGSAYAHVDYFPPRLPGPVKGKLSMLGLRDLQEISLLRPDSKKYLSFKLKMSGFTAHPVVTRAGLF